MSKTTRMHISPVALLAVLGVVAMLALMTAVVWLPGSAQAQDGPSNPFGTTPTATPGNGTDPGNGGGGTTPTPTETPTDSTSTIASSSTTGGSNVSITLTIAAAEMENLVAGDRIEIYLEDDYSVPDSIPGSSVYVQAIGATSIDLNAGGRVYVSSVSIDTDDHFTVTKDDYAISILVPDMDPRTEGNNPFNYPDKNRALTVVIEKSAGINNPTEEGDHSVGFSILTGTEADNAGLVDSDGNAIGVTLPVLSTVAKISISDADNTRGYEMTVTGSGFNDGTTADVFVLSGGTKPADCPALIDNAAASNVGSALVGSDDKAAVTFSVTVPTFEAGTDNYICMRDGEGRTSGTDVESFKLEPSIRVVPSTVSAGDIVNVFAEDYPVDGAAFEGVLVSKVAVAATAGSIRSGSATATFEVPGNVGGLPLQGTVRVDAT